VWSGLKEGDPALHFKRSPERTNDLSISMVATLAKLEFERAEY
jgi:hypothetical protein